VNKDEHYHDWAMVEVGTT